MKTTILFYLLALSTFWLQAQSAWLDPSFGNMGKVTTNFGFQESCEAIYTLPDGKLLVAGLIRFNAQYSEFLVIRYLPDGSLDTSFGTSGITRINFNSGLTVPSDIVVGADNKILVSASRQVGFASLILLVQIEEDGGIDETFGDNGIVTFEVADFILTASALALQSDGKIVIGGTYASLMGRSDFLLLRFLADGSFDTSFGEDGQVISDLNGRFDQGSDIAIQPDGKIILGGSSLAEDMDYDYALARYNTDGSLDDTFGNAGIVIADFEGNKEDEGTCLLLTPDGKILLGGLRFANETFPSNTDFALLQFLSDGTLDQSFGVDGKVSTNVNENGADRILELSLQADGKILAAGSAQRANQDYDFALVRYEANGTIDPSFGEEGILRGDFEEGNDFGRAIVVQEDGKIIIGGQARLDGVGANDVGLIRYFSEVDISAIDFTAEAFQSKIFPNPTSSTFQVQYTLSQSAKLSIDLFDVAGQKVQTLLPNSPRSPGVQQENFQLPPELAAGVYWLVFNDGQSTWSKKIVKPMP